MMHPAQPASRSLRLREQTLRELAPQADVKGIVYRSRETRTWVDADPALVALILRNLVSNAIRYTERGGVLVGCRIRRTKVLVEVWDTGIGLDPRDHQRVFEPFTQVDSGFDRHYVGSGLGLTLAARFVELHGGTIEVVSSLGAGARFTVLLPVLGPAEPPGPDTDDGDVPEARDGAPEALVVPARPRGQVSRARDGHRGRCPRGSRGSRRWGERVPERNPPARGGWRA